MFEYKCVNLKSFVKNLEIVYLLHETDEVWKTCQHYLLRIFSMKFCLIYLPSNSINAALIGPNAICFCKLTRVRPQLVNNFSTSKLLKMRFYTIKKYIGWIFQCFKVKVEFERHQISGGGGTGGLFLIISSH